MSGSAPGAGRPGGGRLSALLEAVAGVDEVFVLTHDNPDPDALASAAALAILVRHVAGLTVHVALGGIVGRAENRALIAEMELVFERIDGLDIPTEAGIAMVDTQPHAGNNSLPAGRSAAIVIDHHPVRTDRAETSFADIRPHYGASASILVEYLQEAELEPGPWLATALFYAIQSETLDLGREASEADVAASTYLYPRSDPQAISRIRHARVPASYFRSMHEALALARRYGSVVAVAMGRLPYPDMVAEVADIFLQLEDATWTVASGRYRDRLLFSLRTFEPGAHAGQRIRGAIGDRGAAGGHGSLAGGQLDLRGMSDEEVDGLQAAVMADLLRALGEDPDASDPLVPDPDDA
ncbi:MAG: DHH family phosphoesterase [Gemmatimonadetes bacterium]|nr:DHH family phosphoesterase [Gemmatimonadota bacterium]